MTEPTRPTPQTPPPAGAPRKRPGPGHPRAATSGFGYGLGRRTYLVISADPRRQDWLRTDLEALGPGGLRVVDDAATAFQVLEKGGIDLIISDMHPPHLSGIAFTRLLRRGGEDTLKRLPVILLAETPTAHQVVDARNAGVNEVLCQPYGRADLHKRIRACLLNPRPFIDTPGYVGPCRRTGSGLAPEGHERRVPAHPDADPALPAPPAGIDSAYRKP